jgi:5-methylthioadenosine/S-adenosylhomocysteine deaminase
MDSNFDRIVHNGAIITMNPKREIIQNGFIGIKQGKIAAVGQSAPEKAMPYAADSIDAENGLIMPGLVNTHTHMPMAIFRGLADDLPLDTWLNEHIFPAEAAHINPENVRLGTLLSCAEMLLSGTTTFCGGYFLEDEVADIVADVGMRGVLGQGVIDFPAPGVPDPRNNVKVAVSFVEKWMDKSPRIRPSIFCHSAYTCSQETLKGAKAAAESTGVLFQIHAAETKNEKQMIQMEIPVSTVRYLKELGVLDRQTLLVHAVWVNEADIKAIKESGSSISHNAESNMKLGSGIAPVHKFLKQGIAVGLGTDGCASNNDLDLFQEMDMVAKLHKVSTLDPTVMDAETVLKMATIVGAQTIGLGDMVGSIEIGKEADLIVIDTDRPHLTPMYHPISQLVYAARGSDVRHVMVSGEPLVKNRKLLTIDETDVLKKMHRLSRAIAQKNPNAANV